MKNKMILGIDIGYSSSKFVVLKENKLVYTFLSESKNEKNIKKITNDLIKKFYIKKIGITGGRSKILDFHFNVPTKTVNEISAIGIGGLFQSKKNESIVVSCGTGTCIVYVKDKNVVHLGGTGVGGGTILGLSKLLLKTQNIKEIEKLASKGDLANIDLTVKDIIGSSIGKLLEDITASNFGKIKNPKRENLAIAILNLVAESIATNSLFASGNDPIFLAGRVPRIKFVNKKIKEIGKLFDKEITTLPYAEFTTALGAAILCKK